MGDVKDWPGKVVGCCDYAADGKFDKTGQTCFIKFSGLDYVQPLTWDEEDERYYVWEDDENNVFVAHRLVDCGFSVPSVHYGRYNMRDWPPLANEWADSSFLIPDWSIISGQDFPRPGYVAIKPSSGQNGHMGILDFDGMAISAQVDLVTRRSDFSSWDGAVCRKYMEE